MRGPSPQRPRKKSRAPRVRLTHFEIKRGETLCLRIAIADDTFAEVGDELGALIKRIVPSTRTSVIAAADVPAAPEFVVSPTHSDHDENYHAGLRDHLAALFGSLCDTALGEALEIVHQERDRRAEGGN